MKQTARIIRNNVPRTLLPNGITYGEPLHCPTVADARLLPDPPPPAISIGSAGVTVSGTYYWDSASTATDDGQTVIKVAAITTGRYIPVSIVTSGGGGGTGLSVANPAALKAVLSTTLTDTQPATMQTPGSNWVWSASTGSGFESDDVTVIRPNNVLLASNGRWYNTSPAPVVPTYAAARLAVSGKQPSISVQARSSQADGGAGTFDYDASDTTSPDNDATVLVAGTRRYKRRYSGALDARWYGVRADVREISDGVTTAGSATLTSATAAFTAADTGKRMLINVPHASSLAQGGLTLVATSTSGTGVGTDLAVDLPVVEDLGSGVGQPRSGGAIWVNGHIVVVQYIYPATETLSLITGSPTTCTAAAFYTEPQQEVTITYVNATTVTMSAQAAVNATGVKAVFGTDDSSALGAAIQAGFDLDVAEVHLPAGLIGITENLIFADESGLRIRGPAGTACTLSDLRKGSTEYSYPIPDISYGTLSFDTCTGVILEDVGYDANLPTYAVLHSTGSVSNAAGGRMGFYFSSSPDCKCIRVRAEGWGARDEHIVCDGLSHNFEFVSCHVVGNNNVSINANCETTTYGVKVSHCHASGLLVNCGSYLIDHCHIYTDNDIIAAGIAVDTFGNGIIDACIIRDFTTLTSVAAIDVFGTLAADATLVIKNCTLRGITNRWDVGEGAGISIKNHGGTVVVEGNTFHDCDAASTGGRFIRVSGASTGKVKIDNNVCRGGTNMTIGVSVDSAVPASAVEVGRNNTFATSVTTPHSFGVAVEQPGRTVIISATGTTTLGNDVHTADVTANGSVTVNLPSAVLVGKRKRVTVNTASTQLGTTTVGSVAGTVDTTSIVGALQSVTYQSDGTRWLTVASNLLNTSSITRVLKGIPFVYSATDADIDEYGRVVVNVTTGTLVKIPVEVPQGATLTALTLQVIGGGNVNLPAVMPRFRLRTLTVASNGTATSSDAVDGSANVGVYNAQHAITLSGLTEVINNETKRYVIEFISESGANAVTGFQIIAPTATFTPASPDRGAS